MSGESNQNTFIRSKHTQDLLKLWVLVRRAVATKLLVATFETTLKIIWIYTFTFFHFPRQAVFSDEKNENLGILVKIFGKNIIFTGKFKFSWYQGFFEIHWYIENDSRKIHF